MSRFESGDADDAKKLDDMKLTEGAADDPLSPSAKVFKLVKEGHFDEAVKQLEESPSLWHEVETEGYTLLHWGALAGQRAFVETALKAGIQVDVCAKNLQTPLMWAVIKGHIGVSRDLINAQASIYIRDSYGATPLILAIQHQQQAAVLLLVAMSDPPKLLGQVDSNGCGPTHWAAYKGDMTSLKLLEYFDADFHLLDNTRMTVLHRAAQSSQNQIVEMLVEKEVDPSQKDSQGRTCYDLAEQNQDELMKRSLKRFLAFVDESGSVIMESSKTALKDDIEAGASGKILKRKVKDTQKQQLDNLRDQAVGYVASAFWLVCVSLSLFQYINDLRVTCWEVAPTAALLWELGVPASLALFLYTALSDPGKVPARVKGISGVEDLMKVYSQGSASEVAQLDIARLCTTTWVVKGMRTKYCKSTGACVEEFDHFCGWLNCAIGKKNHRPFMCLAVTEVCTQLVFLWIAWAAALQLVKSSTMSEWFAGIATAYPLLMLMAGMHMFTVPGVLMLTFYQARLVAVNLLTNEMMNAHRYKHFWVGDGDAVPGPMKRPRKVFRNIFDKGDVFRNCMDFWWIRRRSDRGPVVVSRNAKK